MTPRIVLLSDHRAHGQRLAQALIARGLRLHAVVLETGDAPPKTLKPTLWNRGLLWRARRRLAFVRSEKPFYAALCDRVFAGGQINSPQMTTRLGKIAPDYIVVGTGKILSAALIETASQGVFNVHPALLPWVRGSGVVRHALDQGIAVGATLHYIDPGIDTGALVERRLLPLEDAPLTLPELEAKTDVLGAQMMADIIEALLKTGEKPPATPQTARFPLHKWPTMAERRAQNQAFEMSRALTLFEAWQDATSGAPDWKLPPDLLEAPRDVP